MISNLKNKRTMKIYFETHTAEPRTPAEPVGPRGPAGP